MANDRMFLFPLSIVRAKEPYRVILTTQLGELTLANTNLEETTENNITYPFTAISHIHPQKIEVQKRNLDDTVLHEFIHACQYSYTNIANENWTNTSEVNTKYEIALLCDGMAINIVDAINRLENNGKLDNSYVANWARDYFFQKYSSNGPNLSFPEPYFRRQETPYVMGLLFYHFSENYGRKLYGGKKYGIEIFHDIMLKVQENKNVIAGIKNVKYDKNETYPDIFHKFNLNSALLHKQNGVYGILEKNMYVTQNPPSFPIELDIKSLPSFSPGEHSIILMPNSVKYYKMAAPEGNIIKDCVYVFGDFFDSNFQAAYVIKKWKNKSDYTFDKLPIDGKGKITFQYITSKGTAAEFNPETFIFMFSNASNRPIKNNISCNVTITSPDSLPTSYDRKMNLELSKLSGDEYKKYMQDLYLYYKRNCDAVDAELCKLIASYSTSESIDKIIYGYKRLNLSMQEGIVSAHDIRYQFYLRKNYIVSKICEGATSASVLAQLKRLKEYLDDINAVLNNAHNDKIISVIGAMVGDHALTQLTNTKNPMDTPWTDEEDKVNQSINSVKGKIQSVWKKSPYFFNSSDFGNAYTAVGNPAFEIVYQIGKQPAPVNIVPNLKNEPFAKDMVYTISSTVKNFTGVNYKEYLFSDKCDPMDLKYFSVIKKHDYREEFMPPEPGTPGYFKELNEIAYFRLNAHKCKYENIDLMPPDIIAAVSRKYEEFKRRTIDAIIIQFHKGKFDLLNSIKENAASIDARDELLTILTAVLKEINAAEVVNANAPNDICKITDLIDEITVMLRK